MAPVQDRLFELSVSPFSNDGEIAVEMLRSGTSLASFSRLMIRLAANGGKIRTGRYTYNPLLLVERIKDILLRGKESPHFWCLERDFPNKYGIRAWVNDYLHIYQLARLHPLRYHLDDMIVVTTIGEVSLDGCDWLAREMATVAGYEAMHHIVGDQLSIYDISLPDDPCISCNEALIYCSPSGYCQSRLMYVAATEMVAEGASVLDAISVIDRMREAG